MLNFLASLRSISVLLPYIIYPLLILAAWAIIKDKKIRILSLFVLASIPIVLTANVYSKFHSFHNINSDLIQSCGSIEEKDQVFNTVSDVRGVYIDTTRNRILGDPYISAENYLNVDEWNQLFLGGHDGYSYVEEKLFDNKKFQTYEIVKHQINRRSYENKRSNIDVKWELISQNNGIKHFDLVVIDDTTNSVIGRKQVLIAEFDPILLPITPIELFSRTELSCPRQSSLVHFIKKVAVPNQNDGGIKL